MNAARAAAALVLAVLAWPAAAAQETKDVFQGPAAEEFLRRARVQRVHDINMGVTRPQRVTLVRDGVTRSAVFKTINIDDQRPMRMADGSVQLAFQDSYLTEIAAYEVDKIIGLGMVPATIRRTVLNQTGSLQWWVESMMPEAQRTRDGIDPPDAEAWNRKIYMMRLFDRLIYNVDRHANNMLITADFDLRLIDHSRAFRPFSELQEPATLRKFSRPLLAGLERLEYGDLRGRLSRYLRDAQIKALLARRDLILALVKERVAREGEAAVLYD